MDKVSVALFWVAFAGLAGSSVLFSYELIQRRAGTVPAKMVAAISLLILTVSIGLNSMANKGTPLTGGNELILAAWALLVLFFLIEYVLKFKKYGIALVPVAVILMAVAQLVGRAEGDIAPVSALLGEQMQGLGVGFHVLLIVFANMLFLVAAIASALYLYQDKQLKTHSTSLLSRRLPALANLEKLASRSVTIALPVYLAGQLLGVIRAINVDAAGWWSDPRVMMSAAVLIVFVVFSVLTMRNKMSGRTTSWIAVVGGILVIVLMIIARTLPVGFHVFGNII
ncbi:MAG: cytochrome c biogenesis protein CcsA [Coriobacteriia bacterium]|nr:cytochrome c biogenesis protein CcsA [Coriobacteriia bacterium]